MIVKRGAEWCLFSKDGSKNLGCYASRAAAQDRERQVNMFKYKEDTHLHDDIVLVDQETVADFMADLCEAFAEAFEFFADHWWLKDVASDWLVVCVCDADEPGEMAHYKIEYARAADGSFTFGDAVNAVEPMIVYAPADVPGGPDDDAPLADATTTADVALVPGAGGKVRKKGKAPVAKRATAVMPTVGGTKTIAVPPQANLAPEAAADKPGPGAGDQAATPADKKKPPKKKGKQFGGKPTSGDADVTPAAATEQLSYEERVAQGLHEAFEDAYQLVLEAAQPASAQEAADFIRVYEGRGGVAGKVNLNNRLYGKAKMRENVDRLVSAIVDKAAWVPGEADHPESGPRILATCTKLLGLSFDEATGDVRVRFGVVPTSAGKDIAVLADRKFPIGVSTRSIGYAKVAEMSEDNPYFAANPAHAGKQYDHIDEFTIQAFDLVVQPSAGTFLGEAVTEQTLAAAAARITRQTEDEMNKDQFEKLTPEELKAQFPALYQSVAEAISGDVAASLKEEAKQLAGADTAQLAEQVRELTAKNAAIESIVDQITRERDQATLRSAKRKAVDEKVAGLQFGDARRRYLEVHYLEQDGVPVEAIEGLMKSFDENFARFLPAPALTGTKTAPSVDPFLHEDTDIFGAAGVKLTNGQAR